MNTPADHKVEATRCLARSILWQAASLGLRRPDRAVTARLATREGIAALAEAAATAHAPLVTRIEALATASAPTEQTFFAIFGHTARGTVPPYETEWGRDDLYWKPHILANLGAFLEAFGLTLNRERHERVDHLSCEAELLAFLLARRARALDDGDGEAAESTARAERLLLRDHLARFVPAFARSLAREDKDGFYGRLGDFLYDLVEAECALAQVPVGSPTLSLRPTDFDDEELTCGTGNELIQIQSSMSPQEAKP